MKWLLVALVLLVPLASAHVDSYSQFRSVAVGPYLIGFEPRPTVPFANTSTSVVAQFQDNDTGAPLRSVPSSVLVAGPNDYVFRAPLNPDGTGYHVASTILPWPGNYSARVIIPDESTGQNYSADTTFEVFPDIPYRIRPVDLEADAIIGEVTRLAFEIVDPDTFARKDPGDLSIRIEHWSEDHTQFLGAEDATATRLSPGIWRIEHVFKEGGMYHIRFASDAGGFNYADVPLLHVYAQPPSDNGPDATQDTPWPTLGVVALVLVLVLVRGEGPARQKAEREGSLADKSRLARRDVVLPRRR